MTVELGSFTPGSTGNTTLNLNGTETPILIEFWVGPRTNTTETTVIKSTGVVDITNDEATWMSIFSDSTSKQTKADAGDSTTSCLQHYARVSGTITKVLDITYVSCASGQFTVDVGTSNSNYRIYFKAYG